MIGTEPEATFDLLLENAKKHLTGIMPRIENINNSLKSYEPWQLIGTTILIYLFSKTFFKFIGKVVKYSRHLKTNLTVSLF